MKYAHDVSILAKLVKAQQGVFSTADLEAALADRHSASFSRRVQSLLDTGTLRRFVRGWYVAESFDLETLSQRIAPRSYVSFGNVLARQLLIGTQPARQVMAAKVGRARRYVSLDFEIVHFGIAPHLDFGHEAKEGVEYADRERAVLDVLYFHLRGQSYYFDIFSDIDFSRLDNAKVRGYLARYRNPKFIAFASNLLGTR